MGGINEFAGKNLIILASIEIIRATLLRPDPVKSLLA